MTPGEGPAWSSLDAELAAVCAAAGVGLVAVERHPLRLGVSR